MPVESPEERTVEVLALPPEVDEELLCLYFENKRRSGGGPLVSVQKKDDRAVLVFEQAEAAAQVLSKGHHVLHNAEMTVRKPASKDHRRLLLQGVNPNTNDEMIELYVENLMGLSDTDYSLCPSPGRDLILIQLSQPFSKDFQALSDRISKRKLDGAQITLEQVDQTDSILVEKLSPGTDLELLTLYFESKDGGNLDVKEVTKLSESAAKVSFAHYESVERVLDLPHKLGDAELVVTPYFDFLQPTQTLAAQGSGAESQEMSDRDSEDLSDMQVQSSLPNAEGAQSQAASQMSDLPDTAAAVAAEVAEAQMEEVETLSDVIPITDKVKLAVFDLSNFQKDAERSHPDVTIQIRDTGVHVTAADRRTLDLVALSVRDLIDKMVEVHFTVEPEKAELFASRDVKERLLQALIDTGSPPAMYTVSDCEVAVTSLSQDSADQACSFLQSQLSSFSLPVDPQYESIFYCREWSEFLLALGFCSVRVSEQGGSVDVWTLKGMEEEIQTAILTFISTPIERETVVTMEPGVLKYIQTYQHQLLVDMDQVSIFPLEAQDVCGLKIHGHATACQMAEEVLQSVASSVCTQTITVNAPGVTRYFAEEECQSLLREMERRFLVHIVPKQVPWEPLRQQDIFVTAWTMMSQKNFQRSSPDASTVEVNSDSARTNGAADAGLLEQAKKIVSSVEERLEQDASFLEQIDDMDQLDLYTAEELSSPGVLDASQPVSGSSAANGLPQLSDAAKGLSSDLEEEAQLSLAIQYSMETSQWSQEDEEEEQLRKALELSKKMIQEVAAGKPEVEQKKKKKKKEKDSDVSLQVAISSANTLQLRVFAGYDCDLSRVNIAFGKRVSQRQVEERLEHRTLRNMSEYHRNCVEMIKRKNAVDIQIQGTIIIVSGFKDYVVGALCDVKLLLEKMAGSLSDREILRTVQWVHHDPASAAAVPYSPDAIVFLENVWRMKVPQIDMLLDNQPHTVNFEKMQEHNIVSGKTVKISRMLGDLDVEVPEEEYSTLSGLPEVSKLDEGSDEFQNVVKSFYESIREYHSKIRIVKVEKLMNRLLYNQYKLKKASVLQLATYPEIERTLYHGTSEASVKEICIHGFNRSFCGKNATVYGQGVYFAVESALSVQETYSPANADGHKFVFVSKVLTGDYTKGCHSMKTAPLKETGDIPLRYDSVTDDINKPSMFVIFNDTQAFPEYLITCQSMHR